MNDVILAAEEMSKMRKEIQEEEEDDDDETRTKKTVRNISSVHGRLGGLDNNNYY
jgi:hypothetical protein